MLCATYSYDAIYRLTNSTQGEAYSYDAVGNRLNGPASETYSYNSGNELITATGTPANPAYAGVPVWHAYDPMGRRIEKNVNGTITSYVYDNEAIILAYNAAGNIKAKYTHGLNIDEPLAVKKSDDIYYYHADGLGSIVALTDAAGAVVETYSYDSFGNMTKTGDIRQPFTYTGREFDSETGLYYYRARYYDSKAGRFVTKDPIGFDGGINQYAYVDNNPIKYRDPYGLKECRPLPYLSCLVGCEIVCDLLFGEFGPPAWMLCFLSCEVGCKPVKKSCGCE